MSYAGIAAAMGRRAAEARMDSTCTIREPATTRTDPGSGEVIDVPGLVVYTGRCRIRPPESVGTTAEAGGDRVFEFDLVVSVPFAVAGVREDLPVTVDTSPDPALAGSTVWVQHVPGGDDLTARRLFCRRTRTRK